MIAAIASDHKKKQVIFQMTDIKSLRLFVCLFVCVFLELYLCGCLVVCFFSLFVCVFLLFLFFDYLCSDKCQHLDADS